MTSPRLALITSLLAASAFTVFAADTIEISSGERAIPLVELFTSEGCSSCPPAEKWLGDLTDERGLWKEFVPVAWHVDYWDYIGWKDRFASGTFTLRQRLYAREWNSSRVYTPCFVWHGEEWDRWFRDKTHPAAPQGKPGRLSATSEDGLTWKVSFQPNDAKSDDWVACAALLACDQATSVRSGENRGRTLRHEFVALEFKSAGTSKRGNQQEATLEFSKDSLKNTEKAAIAVWITHRGTQAPIQALGGYLPRK